MSTSERWLRPGLAPAREAFAAPQEEETWYVLPQHRLDALFCCACVVEMVMLALADVAALGQGRPCPRPWPTSSRSSAGRRGWTDLRTDRRGQQRVSMTRPWMFMRSKKVKSLSIDGRGAVVQAEPERCWRPCSAAR